MANDRCWLLLHPYCEHNRIYSFNRPWLAHVLLCSTQTGTCSEFREKECKIEQSIHENFADSGFKVSIIREKTKLSIFDKVFELSIYQLVERSPVGDLYLSCMEVGKNLILRNMLKR